MPPPLTIQQLAARAQAELDKAKLAHFETIRLGRTAPRTTRLRAARRRARALLRRAIWRGLPNDEAKKIFESGPPDPEFGEVEW